MPSFNESGANLTPPTEKMPLPAKRRFSRKTFITLTVILILVIGGYFIYAILAPWRAEDLVRTGEQYYSRGDLGKAESNFKQASQIYLNGSLPYAYLGLMKMPDFSEPAYKNIIYARAALMNKKTDFDNSYREAVSYFEKAFSLGVSKDNFSNYQTLLHDSATAYRIMENYDKATEKYLEEIKTYPDSSFWARYWVALDYYGRVNKPREALDMMNSALSAKDIDSSHLYRVYFSLGNYYKYFDDEMNAEKYARLALQSAPQNRAGEEEEIAWVHILLAELAGRRGNIILAEQEVKKASELVERGAFGCELAAIYYENNLYGRAIAEAGKVANLGSATRICTWVLGMANLKQGYSEEAKKYFDDFLRLADETKIKSAGFFRQIEEIKEKLKGFQ